MDMCINRNRKMQKNPYTNMTWHDSDSDKWQLKRKQRLNNICDMLKALRVVQHQEFVAKLAITTGIRSHVIRTYLDEIKTAGLITIKNNMIYWNNESEAFVSRV